ncbi:uncharacterized protein [Ambystoma mexicanum]|uniref:uncharacterized protein isoform X2 n=1 Tax=Ambystoma mexicanum TaxID=8296 RepID=UPI0037E96A0A
MTSGQYFEFHKSSIGVDSLTDQKDQSILPPGCLALSHTAYLLERVPTSHPEESSSSSSSSSCCCLHHLQPCQGTSKMEEDARKLELVEPLPKNVQKSSIEDEKITPQDSEEPGPSNHVIHPEAVPVGATTSESLPNATPCVTSTQRQDPPQLPTPQPALLGSSSSSSSSGSSGRSSGGNSSTDDASSDEMEKDEDTVKAEQEQTLILNNIRTAMRQVAHTIRLRHMELTKVNSNLLRVLKDHAALRRDMAAMGRDMASQNSRITAIQGDILGVQRAMQEMITRVSEIISIQAQAAVAAMFPSSFATSESEDGYSPQPIPESFRPRMLPQSAPAITTAARGHYALAVPPQQSIAMPPHASRINSRDRRMRQGRAPMRGAKPYAKGRGGWGRGNGV